MSVAAVSLAEPARAGDDRTISFFHIHTKETLTIQYKKDGRFDPEAMKKINWILRDWRADKATTMDPNTVDIIWEMHRELGSQQPVHIISGYRSPATNEMLRRTRGGQAKQSQHMTGKAIDIAFPDVPLRRMRYSAMIRERGGVGYYPTSGIPFVHVDTGRVRHWPRMVHDELALLFPSGRSKHQSTSGSISPADVKRARERRKDLAQEVAQFYALRDAPKAPVMVAEAAPVVAKLPVPPQPKAAVRPLPAPEKRMAVGAPLPPVEATAPQAMVSVATLTSDTRGGKAAEPAAAPMKTALAALPPPPPAPKLVAAPRPVDRPSKFVAKLPDADRSRLDTLVKLASLDAVPPPAPAVAKPLMTGSTARLDAPLKAAAMGPSWPFSKPAPLTATKDAEPETTALAHPFGNDTADWRSGWTVAPEFDEDHPDELSYRPFELAPLLTETPSFDDPALAILVHPDAGAAMDMLDDEGVALPLQFGPGHMTTAMAWAQQFSGDAVHLDGLAAAPSPDHIQPQLAARSVKTESR